MDLILPLKSVTLFSTLCRMILLCGNYSQIIILYENSTIPILEPFLLSSSCYSSIIINVDLLQKKRYEDFYSDDQSLIVLVFDNTAIRSTTMFRMQFDFKTYCHHLFVSSDNNVLDMNFKVLRIALRNKLDNVGLILVNSIGTIHLSYLIYNQMTFVKIIANPKNECYIYDQMLHSKTKDLKGENKYVYFTLDIPRTLNLTSRKNNGKEVFGVGGPYAYLASLIPRKFNITLQMCTVHFSADHNESTYGRKFFEGFMEKTYEADNLTPTQLNYITIASTKSSMK